MPAIPPALRAAFGGGLAAAGLYMAILSGSAGGMILVYLAPLPLFVAGLTFGPAAVLVATIVATVLIVMVAGSFALPLAFLITSALPVLLLVRQALLSRQLPDGSVEWYPPGLLLAVLVALGCALIVVACALASVFGNGGGLKSLIHGMLVDVLGDLFHGTPAVPGVSPDETGANVIAGVFPGMVVAWWLVMVIANGLLAQAVLARFKRLRRPPLRMSEVELPGWGPLVLALAMTGALVLDGQPGFLLVNLAIVLALPFLFAGLAVVHAFAAGRSSKPTILVAFYILVLLLAWPVLALIGLGIIDQWAGLRRRFGAGCTDRGDV